MRGLVLLALAFSALLFGCISSETVHVQNADGSADITQTTDMSALTSLYGDSSTSYYSTAITDAMGKVCEGYDDDVTCSEADGVVTLKKHFKPKEAFYKFETKDDIIFRKYRLTVDRIEPMGGNTTSMLGSGGTDSTSDDYYSDYTSPYGSSLGGYGDLGSEESITLSSARAKAMGAMLESMKMEYKYIVRMPGKISSAPGAVSMNDSEARFDLIERMKGREPIVVESEEVNWPLLVILGIIGFMVLVLVVLGAMLMLKPKKV